MDFLSIVLASAVVSAVVSSLLTLWGQYLERKSRKEEHRLERERKREELLLSKAIELALTRTDLIKDLALASKQKATFKDSLLLANSYYKDLQLLLDTGDIREETKKKWEESNKKNKTEEVLGAQ